MQKHPRQHEVLHRTRNEKRRINRLYKEGKIDKSERDQLAKEANSIRKEDQADVKANGDYITKDQQRVMNSQENNLNKEIKQDAASTPAAVPTTPAQ